MVRLNSLNFANFITFDTRALSQLLLFTPTKVPFYKMAECMSRIEGYVDNINKNLERLRTRGPYSKYRIDLGESVPDSDTDHAKLELVSKEAAGLYEGTLVI